MYLYYVVGTEPSKGRKESKQDTHALLARSDEALEKMCADLFVSYEAYHAKHKLNKDWK